MEVLESRQWGANNTTAISWGDTPTGGSSYSYPDTADQDTLPPSFFFFSKILRVYTGYVRLLLTKPTQHPHRGGKLWESSKDTNTNYTCWINGSASSFCSLVRNCLSRFWYKWQAACRCLWQTPRVPRCYQPRHIRATSPKLEISPFIGTWSLAVGENILDKKSLLLRASNSRGVDVHLIELEGLELR